MHAAGSAQHAWGLREAPEVIDLLTGPLLQPKVCCHRGQKAVAAVAVDAYCFSWDPGEVCKQAHLLAD